jgi:hypothetical protein
MCAARHGLARGCFICSPAEDQNQGGRRCLQRLVERVEALAGGWRQIKQDHLATL